MTSLLIALMLALGAVSNPANNTNSTDDNQAIIEMDVIEA